MIPVLDGWGVTGGMPRLIDGLEGFTESSDGNVLATSMDGSESNGAGANWHRIRPAVFTVETDLWTLDYRVSYDPNDVVTVPGNYNPIGPTIFPLAAGGTATDSRRVELWVGGRSNGPMDGVIEVRQEGTFRTEVDVAGDLDPTFSITNQNVYRIVGTGEGNIKVYINDIVDPVFDDFVESGEFGGRATGIEYGFQIDAGTNKFDIETDFIRVDIDESFDEAPGNLDEGIPGDFDGSGVVDAADIDLLCTELGGANGDFDLTGDGMVHSEDADELILNILMTEYGDADLIGGATLGDLGTLAGNFVSTRTDFGWADGDFNWDGEVTLGDLGDLGILAANFGPNGPIPQAEFETAVEAALADLVPEPATASLLVLCLGLLSRRRRRQRSPGAVAATGRRRR